MSNLELMDRLVITADGVGLCRVVLDDDVYVFFDTDDERMYPVSDCSLSPTQSALKIFQLQQKMMKPYS